MVTLMQNLQGAAGGEGGLPGLPQGLGALFGNSESHERQQRRALVNEIKEEMREMIK